VTAEYVARGACVQAAAALTGRDVAQVASDWAPETAVIEPDPALDAATVRGAYAEVRHRTHPETGVTP
jgi:hypothetical protein